MAELVTIKVSDSAGKVAVMKSYLEDNDIYCFLKDEISSQISPIAMGGIKLQVREEDVQQAIIHLINGGFAKKEDYQDDEQHPWLAKALEIIGNLFK